MESVLCKWFAGLFCYTMICLQSAKAQFDEKGFVLYSTKDGLSSNETTGILQDAYGYIWIGTRKGLTWSM